MKDIACRVIAMLTLGTGIAGMASCEVVSHQEGPQPTAVAHGEQIYRENCIGCHAARGTGDAFLAVPALAGQRRQYLLDQLQRFSTDERHSPQMQQAFKRLSVDLPQAAADVSSYLSRLPVQRFAEGDPRFQAEGRVSYLARCASCHGADARGNADGTAPSLRAQHDSYLMNRLRRFATTRPAVLIEAHVVDDHAIIAVSAYLSSLQGMPIGSPPTAHPKSGN